MRDFSKSSQTHCLSKTAVHHLQNLNNSQTVAMVGRRENSEEKGNRQEENQMEKKFIYTQINTTRVNVQSTMVVKLVRKLHTHTHTIFIVK